MPQHPQNTDKSDSNRKPYVKPLLEQVNLLPEQAVLATGCKTDMGAGQVSVCATSCPANGT